MSNVLVLDTQKRPLNPVHPGRARKLLSEGKAAVYRRYPFTIILQRVVDAPVQPLRLKIDPGSQTTGLAVVNDETGEVVWAAELTHRGQVIHAALVRRRAVRHSRRQRKTRYRKPRFRNRSRPKGWLPPSLESRIANILTWVHRLMRFAPLSTISHEVVKFDTQAMENPEIVGVEYQQGELAGYEVREYLLEKWGRQCAYCGKQDVPLQVEHILCRARGGSQRVSNLTLACEPCNQRKGTQLIEDFLRDKPDVLKRILTQAKAPLKDATAVNATRWELLRRLHSCGLAVEGGTGGRTKYNRTRRALPKTHWIDAACVGASTPVSLSLRGVIPLLISANGRGHRQMCGMSKHGFPIRHRGRKRQHFGFQTGDLVRAVVATGKYQGEHVGRVLVRASGFFDIQTKQGRIQGISHRHCTPIHRCDGYSYQQGERV